MNRSRTYRLLFIAFLSGMHLFTTNAMAGKRKNDSLFSLIAADKMDTSRVSHLNLLSWELGLTNSDTAMIIARDALKLGIKLNWKRGIAIAYHNLSWFYFQKGDYALALENGFRSVEISEAITKGVAPDSAIVDYRELASTLDNIGSIYRNQGDYPRALESYLKALKIDEQLDDMNSVARHLGNMGNVYIDQKEFEKALECNFKALKINEETKSDLGLAYRYSNLGIIYMNLKNYPKSLEWYFKAVQTAQKIKDKRVEARAYGNIGNVYVRQNNEALAQEYFLRSLKMNEELQSRNSIAIQLGNLGELYTNQKKYKEAEQCLLKAWGLDTVTGFFIHLNETHRMLSELYKGKRDFKKAIYHYKQYTVTKDSIFNQDRNKELTRHQLNYDFEKKAATATAEQEKKDAVSESERKRQQIVLILVSAVLFLVFILTFFIVRSLQVARKQKLWIEIKNKETEEQKVIIMEKNKDIIDSIKYAKRIQLSLLPTEKYIKKNIDRLNKKNLN